MNNTTYYNLKTYEGTDKFNPITVEGANIEIIDEVIHDNSLAGVGTAIELTSGTLHALTRDNSETAMFRFTATADYSYGDTFTVDNTPVTAKLSNGTPLPDGAYVINSEVLCCLEGSLLTVFVGSTKATDSDRLGGELPSYYATATDVESAISIANASSVIANDVKDRVDKHASGQPVDLTLYTQVNAYETPCDGYVFIDLSGANAIGTCVFSKNGVFDPNLSIQLVGNSSNEIRTMTFVRKGMQLSGGLTGVGFVRFVPLD